MIDGSRSVDDGLLEVFGHGVPNGTVEVSKETPSGPTIVGFATVRGDGTWSSKIPVAAIGYGDQSLMVRENTQPVDVREWSQSTNLTLVDPASSAIQLEGDAYTALLRDAQTGQDASAALQALADAADGIHRTILYIPPGDYTVSRTLLLKSNTILDASGVTFHASDQWNSSPPGTLNKSLLSWTMISNASYGDDMLRDSNISVEGITLDWDGRDSNTSSGIKFVNVDNVSVKNSTFLGGEDGTAFVGCNVAVVDSCIAIGTTNYGFDNWNGPKNTVIQNSTVYASAFSGIAVTAQPTNKTSYATAENVVVSGNTIYGADRFGIDVDSLNSGSFARHILLADNRVYGPGLGAQVIGPSDDILISGNTFSGAMGVPEFRAANLMLSNDKAEVSNIILDSNIILGAFTNPSAIGTVVVQANNGQISNTLFVGGGAQSAIWLAGQNILADRNQLDPGHQGSLYSNLWGIDNIDISEFSSSLIYDRIEATPTSVGMMISGQGVADLTNLVTDLEFYADDGRGMTIYMPRASGHQLTLVGGEAKTGQAGYGTPGAADVVTVVGSGNADVIRLDRTNGCVIVGSSNETVIGGIGNDTFYVDSGSEDAHIDGGGGFNQIVLVGSPDRPNYIRLGDDIVHIDVIKMTVTSPRMTLQLNSQAGLTAVASGEGVTILAGGASQTLVGGMGTDTLVGDARGDTIFSGRAIDLLRDEIRNFSPSGAIDITDLLPYAKLSLLASNINGNESTRVSVSDGRVSCNIYLDGSFMDLSRWTLEGDGGHGSLLSYH